MKNNNRNSKIQDTVKHIQNNMMLFIDVFHIENFKYLFMFTVKVEV